MRRGQVAALRRASASTGGGDGSESEDALGDGAFHCPSTAAWGILLMWSLIIRYTPIGRGHWFVHGGPIALGFVVGSWFMPLGGAAIT